MTRLVADVDATCRADRSQRFEWDARGIRIDLVAAKTPSPLELEILKHYWDAADSDRLPLGVRDVRLLLEEHNNKPLAHSSVITTLNIMHEKGFLSREKHKNSFRFRPIIKRENVNQQEVANLLERVFDGSAKQLMSALLDSSKVSTEDLAEIKRLIARKGKKGQK